VIASKSDMVMLCLETRHDGDMSLHEYLALDSLR